MAEKSSPSEKTSAGKKNGGKAAEKKSASKGKVRVEPDSFVHVFPDWCKGCGICVEFCPTGVLEMKCQKAVVAHPEKCVRCYLCARRCPDFAIGVKDREGRVNNAQDRLQHLPATKVKGEGDSR
ncbi:MAG: 4Fe-4S dicluster domain-containing protein [Candidatus Aegiribacteria sp.]|nr:4Fe-4S dicluster domain-containing protein [Candidatus Aegiribacteria sp.]